MTDTKTSSGPGEGLKAAFQDVMGALGDRAMHSAKQRITGWTDKLTDLAEGDGAGGAGKKIVSEAAEAGAQGGSPVKGAVKGAVSAGKDKVTDALPGKGGGSKRKPPAATKAMNFVESIDVGVPVSVAFNQWTQYDEWPSFMKKVEQSDFDDGSGGLNTKLHVFWFRRTQESNIQDQIPDERIVWRSNGQKGHVDGCVTFHEIGPRLTRILVTLEYYPKGFVERFGNIWRAQGRRLRLELKHFRRHVMMHTLLNPDEAEGWRGEIEDGEVIRSHDDVVQEEQRAADEQSDENGDRDEQDQEQDQQQDQEQDQDQDNGQQAEDESDDRAGEQAEDESDDQAGDESGDESDDQAGDESGDQAGDESDDQAGDASDDQAGDRAEDESDDQPDDESDDQEDDDQEDADQEDDQQVDETSDNLDESDNEQDDESGEQDDESSEEEQDERTGR